MYTICTIVKYISIKDTNFKTVFYYGNKFCFLQVNKVMFFIFKSKWQSEKGKG